MDEQSEHRNGTGSARPVTVVLVEDHVLVRDQICNLLRGAGIDVLDAVGALQDGYEAVRKHQPDVVVLDNHLPDGLGIDLCRTLTQERPDLAVVIYSGHLTWQDQDDASEAGAAAVVPKTFSGRELIAAIAAQAAPPGSDSISGPRPGRSPDGAA